eukprot:6198141-Pleurochrysis_carterae.AAC.2
MIIYFFSACPNDASTLPHWVDYFNALVEQDDILHVYALKHSTGIAAAGHTTHFKPTYGQIPEEVSHAQKSKMLTSG